MTNKLQHQQQMKINVPQHGWTAVEQLSWQYHRLTSHHSVSDYGG